MRKLYSILTLFILLLVNGCSNKNESYLNNETITISFNYGEREGVYSGNVKGNIPDGYGIFKSKTPDGTDWIYYGEWKDGHFNGNGITEWVDGQKYIGDYKDDYMNGLGVLRLKDGTILTGEFKNDEFISPFKSASSGQIQSDQIDSQSSIESKDESEIQSDVSKVQYEEGTYKVGKTIPSGTYCLINNEDKGSAELEIDYDSLNKFSSIALMLSTNTYAYFSIKEGEYLEIEQGYAIPLDDFHTDSLETYSDISSGMYLVGKDIPAGEYEVYCTSEFGNAKYTVYSEIPSSKDNIFVAADYIDKNGFITVSDGQYILLEDGTMSLQN